jgi:GntR family transcriptional regulator/MocR family aminotransferase
MRADGGALLLVTLDARGREPLYRQLYAQIRQQILSGALRAGHRLPSSRSLAAELRVARSTIVQAFEQLHAEGYIESTTRGATRVSAQPPDRLTRAEPHRSTAPRPQPHAPLSRRAQTIASAWQHFDAIVDRPARAFRTSVPALDIFPFDTWGRLLGRAWRRTTAGALSYADSRGLPALREAVAAYLRASRGVRCDADQVFITTGSQQALNLAAHVLLDPGDEVWIEDPGYFGAGGAMTFAGARLVSVPVDREGLDVAAGIRRAPNAKLAIVTPARHLPLGATLTLPRRFALLEWAASRRSWVLEDDYDSEFRYSTRPLASLQGLDRAGCVIFTGTFSKVMFPALRLGYLVVPPALVDPVARVRRYMDFCPPYLAQAVMAAFIQQGHFERHIRRMRTIYGARRDLLVSLLQRHCTGLLDVDAPDAGLNLVAWLDPHLDDRAVSRRLAAAQVDALPISACALERELPPALLLGFAGIREQDIHDGVMRLRSVLGAVRAVG